MARTDDMVHMAEKSKVEVENKGERQVIDCLFSLQLQGGHMMVQLCYLKACSTGKLMASNTGSGALRSLNSMMKKRW